MVYLPLGFEMVFFCGEGRSLWVTVHTNSFPLFQSSTQTVAQAMALKVPLGWLSVSLKLVSSGSPLSEAQEILRLSYVARFVTRQVSFADLVMKISSKVGGMGKARMSVDGPEVKRTLCQAVKSEKTPPPQSNFLSF